MNGSSMEAFDELVSTVKTAAADAATAPAHVPVPEVEEVEDAPCKTAKEIWEMCRTSKMEATNIAVLERAIHFALACFNAEEIGEDYVVAAVASSTPSVKFAHVKDKRARALALTVHLLWRKITHANKDLTTSDTRLLRLLYKKPTLVVGAALACLLPELVRFAGDLDEDRAAKEHIFPELEEFYQERCELLQEADNAMSDFDPNKTLQSLYIYFTDTSVKNRLYAFDIKDQLDEISGPLDVSVTALTRTQHTLTHTRNCMRDWSSSRRGLNQKTARTRWRSAQPRKPAARTRRRGEWGINGIYYSHCATPRIKGVSSASAAVQRCVGSKRKQSLISCRMSSKPSPAYSCRRLPLLGSPCHSTSPSVDRLNKFGACHISGHTSRRSLQCEAFTLLVIIPHGGVPTNSTTSPIIVTIPLTLRS